MAVGTGSREHLSAKAAFPEGKFICAVVPGDPCTAWDPRKNHVKFFRAVRPIPEFAQITPTHTDMYIPWFLDILSTQRSNVICGNSTTQFCNATSDFDKRRCIRCLRAEYTAKHVKAPLSLTNALENGAFVWLMTSLPIYRAPTYIAVPFLGPQQPQYIGSTLYLA